MEYDDDQQRFVRPQDRSQAPNVNRSLRPQNAQPYRPPLYNTSAMPPGPYQHRTGPSPQYGTSPDSRSRRQRGDNMRSNERTALESKRLAPQYTYRQEALASPLVRRNPSRLSHISALSSAQPSEISRPVSEIEPESVAGPALNRVNVPVTSHTGTRKVRSESSLRGEKSNALRESDTLSSSEEPTAAMEALAAAIRQGLKPAGSDPTVTSGKLLSVRMPFSDGLSSPGSAYTDITTAQRHSSGPISAYQGFECAGSKPSTIAEHDVDDFEKSNRSPELLTPRSNMSSFPIVSADQPGMSSRIPAGRRPPRLDMGVVREAEARGSMTSLSDLIRRATKLASNLDRGRTASRLGHLDFFGSSSEKLESNPTRGSTYSDVLAAFPPPADGAGTPGGNRPTTMWPAVEKQLTGQVPEAQNRPARRCCGLSAPVFVLLLVAVGLLIAAAVLVPVFIVVLPRQRRAMATQCHTSHACLNGGLSVFANNVCSCICVGGFTTTTCSTERDPECTTASLSDGAKTYNGATIGTSVLPVLQDSQKSFNIPLNTTILLSNFAYNNLSCASENSLVDFDLASSSRSKRFVMVPGMISTDPHVPVLNLPANESGDRKRFVIVDGVESPANELQLSSAHVNLPRQDATQSTNGIVYAISSTTSSAPTSSGSATSALVTNSSKTSPGSNPSPTTTNQASKEQLKFAATVVLYVLQSQPEISVAVAANQAMSLYLKSNSSNSNNTVEVISGSERLDADFTKFQIIFANGTRIGGATSS